MYVFHEMSDCMANVLAVKLEQPLRPVSLFWEFCQERTAIINIVEA